MRARFLSLLVAVLIAFAIPGSAAVNFNSTWNTSIPDTSDDKTFKLPLRSDGVYDFTVLWGDGNSDDITTYNQANATHTYATSGVYNVSITGDIKGFKFGIDEDKILDITNWGGLELGNSGGYFYSCENLNITATDAPNLSDTTTLYQTFMFADNFNGDINHWNVSTINHMGSMFSSADSFNQDLNGWDTSSVTNMQSTFYHASAFNGNVSEWNTGAVTTTKSMFANTQFNHSLAAWDMADVTNVDLMFSNNLVFNGNVTEWDLSSAENFNNMFANAASFNQDIGGWDTSSGMYFLSVFNGASVFNQDLDQWDMTSAVTTRNMFEEADAFNGNVSTWNLHQVENTNAMFLGADSFDQDLINWNLSSLADMTEMFRDTATFNGNITTWNVTTVAGMAYAFDNATAFNQNISVWNTTSLLDARYTFRDATAFDQNLGRWDVSGVGYMAGMFDNVQLSASNYDSILIGWAAQPVIPESITFSGGNSTYSAGAAEDARNDTLIGIHSWVITDGGLYVAPNAVNFTWSAMSVSPASVIQYGNVLVKVSVNDSDGSISTVYAKIGTTNYSMTSGTGDSWNYVFSTGTIGTYPVIFYAQDNGGSWNTTNPSLTITVTVTPSTGGLPTPPDTCAGVTCTSYCDGTTYYYAGVCGDDGFCEFQTHDDHPDCPIDAEDEPVDEPEDDTTDTSDAGGLPSGDEPLPIDKAKMIRNLAGLAAVCMIAFAALNEVLKQ